MKRALLITGILLIAGAGIGSWLLYQWVRDELGLDNGYVAVAGIPPGNALINQPSYAGPHPSQFKRPEETFSFPIEYGATGPVNPLFAGRNQYPFVCDSERSGLGQPLVDNTSGWGVPVYAETKDGERSELIIGYSKDCSLPTRVYYAYNTPVHIRKFRTVPDNTDSLPENSDTIVRVETGTINRYMYALLMPSSRNDQLTRPDLSKWNGKLIYYFRGGIGIGFQQGPMKVRHLARDMHKFLKQGYAIAFSTGTVSSNGYNLWLQEDTALRVKKQFRKRYGEPQFTIGYGASGGGLQQYLMDQNNPGEIIDGGVAIVAYPDMVSQITYTLDCELLEYYFDSLTHDTEFWLPASRRSWIEGTASNPTETPRLQWLDNIAHLLRFEKPQPYDGATECNARWRGSIQLVNNPTFTSEYTRFHKDIIERTYWTHWQNNRHVYGTDANGRAPIPWSNVGVQYGLDTLKDGRISTEQFLDLNARIGGWIAQQDMTQERYWHASADSALNRYNAHSSHNMTHAGKPMDPAPRTEGSIDAARGAYQSGNVYLGQQNRPIIDVRPYLDPILDIHHSWSAVSSRQRIQERTGNHDLQVIWMSEAPYKPFREAVAVMDEWLTRADANGGDYIAARPDLAQDQCMDNEGNILHKGPDVWDGSWNGKEDGICTEKMPFYEGSRNVAGEDISSDIFFCQTISPEQAVKDGFYGDVDMTPHLETLKRIFPNGVCDYRLPDKARPTGI